MGWFGGLEVRLQVRVSQVREIRRLDLKGGQQAVPISGVYCDTQQREWDWRMTHLARDLNTSSIRCILLDSPDVTRVDHPELDRTSRRTSVQK